MQEPAPVNPRLSGAIWTRDCARSNATWHAETAAKWTPWPFFFGPLGSATLHKWHLYASQEYGKAAADLDRCVKLGRVPLTLRNYDRVDDAVGRIMMTANYKDYAFGYESVCNDALYVDP